MPSERLTRRERARRYKSRRLDAMLSVMAAVGEADVEAPDCDDCPTRERDGDA